MNLLVTGAAGYFGSFLLPAFAANPHVKAILATDLRQPAFAHDKICFQPANLVVDDLVALMAGIDLVVHLAFAVERKPGTDPADLNVKAHRRLLEAALGGDRSLVFASSVMAYGFRKDMVRLRESDALASAEGFYYAAHKQAAEAVLAELAPRTTGRVVVARVCAVGGPNVDDRRATIYRGKVMTMPGVPHDLLVQVVHEADLASGFQALLTAPSGTYNVAPDDALTTHDVAKLLGQFYVPVPMAVATWFLDQEWKAGRSLMDGDWARTLRFPSQVVDNAKLKGLGWMPAYSTAMTIKELATQPRRSAATAG